MYPGAEGGTEAAQTQPSDLANQKHPKALTAVQTRAGRNPTPGFRMRHMRLKGEKLENSDDSSQRPQVGADRFLRLLRERHRTCLGLAALDDPLKGVLMLM